MAPDSRVRWRQSVAARPLCPGCSAPGRSQAWLSSPRRRSSKPPMSPRGRPRWPRGCCEGQGTKRWGWCHGNHGRPRRPPLGEGDGACPPVAPRRSTRSGTSIPTLQRPPSRWTLWGRRSAGCARPVPVRCRRAPPAPRTAPPPTGRRRRTARRCAASGPIDRPTRWRRGRGWPPAAGRATGPARRGPRGVSLPAVWAAPGWPVRGGRLDAVGWRTGPGRQERSVTRPPGRGSSRSRRRRAAPRTRCRGELRSSSGASGRAVGGCSASGAQATLPPPALPGAWA